MPDLIPVLEFNPNTTAYSGANALVLGKMAKLVYENNEAIRKVVIDDWKFQDIFFFDTSETESFVAVDSEKIIVSFRGSNSFIDWLSNIDIDLVGGPFKGSVHEGFSRALSVVWTKMQKKIYEIKENARPKALSLWFTGHSLGGALATLAVAKLREKDHPVNGLYTFGSPRVGDREFAQNFNADFAIRTYRFVNKTDIVTRVPRRIMFYSHVGKFLYFDDQDSLHKEPSFWYQFLDSIEVVIEDIKDRDLVGVKHHDINQYLIALEKNKAKKYEELN